jgi:hypothetical protein
VENPSSVVLAYKAKNPPDDGFLESDIPCVAK